MVEKLSEGLQKLKFYWKTPPKGYQVCYKEFLNVTLGFGGISFISVLVQWTTLAMNIPMMISYFKVSTGMIFVFGLVGSVIGLVRAPILSMIIDNHNSKKGKFKPFLLWTMVATCVSFGLIPFIPQLWTEQILFAFSIPEIPLFGVASSVINVTSGILVMFLLTQVGSFFYTLLTQCMNGIEQTISTVAQERANIGAFKGLICNIPSSIINIVMPLLAGAIFSVGGVSGMNNIKLYRFFFPICMVGGLIFIMFAVKGTQERVVVNKKYVAKVKFAQGAKQLSKNKYFWIITIFNVAVGIRSVANIYFWACTYGIGGKSGDTAIAVCNMVLNNALIPGMIFGPMLIKKFGKRNVMIVSNVGFTLMVLVQLLFVKNPYMILVCIFFQNLFNGVAYMATIMVSDVLDYQQWRTGKRLEGFWQNYSGFIGTLLGVFTGILSPLFLSFGGIGFGDDINLALQNPELMNSAFKYITLLGVVGSVVAMLPMLFYDLTEKKHANYVRVLKVRAASDNYEINELTDQDVLNVKEILDYTEETKDAFVSEELNKHHCITQIMEHYEEAAQRAEEEKERLLQADKEREKELEEKKALTAGKKKK